MADDFKKAVGKGFKGVKKEVKEERKGKVPGFMQEMAEERKGRISQRAKAKKMTRLMKKGYRKGYRVPKRGTRKSGR